MSDLHQTFEDHVTVLAESRCKAKHPVADSPCVACMESTRQEILSKRKKMVGTEVPAEEAQRIRAQLGL